MTFDLITYGFGASLNISHLAWNTIFQYSRWKKDCPTTLYFTLYVWFGHTSKIQGGGTIFLPPTV